MQNSLLFDTDDIENDLINFDTKIKAVAKGDIWQLGKHRLLCGDATIKSDVEKLMDGANAKAGRRQVDMVFTDPPYNIAYNETYKNKRINEVLGRKFANKKIIKNDNIDNIEEFYFKAFSNMKDILNKHNSFYITCAGKNLYETLKALKDNDLIINTVNVWNKNNFVLSFNDYKGKHEFIVYGWKDRHRFYHKGKYQSSVWDIAKPMRSAEHPTMKPIELIENAIKNSTLENHIVYDCFLGSGSTLIACEYTNRICYGIEIDEHYCGVIIDRWEKFTHKKAIKIKEGEFKNENH